MSDFISKVYIESFRGIKALELNDLLPINILTGDNNSGKTSVLEVLESLENPRDFRLWRSLIRKDLKMSLVRGISYYDGFYHLFDINSSEKKLDYTVEINGIENHVLFFANETEEEMTEEEYNNLQGVFLSKEERESMAENMQMISKLEMGIEINGELVETDNIYEGQRSYIPHYKKPLNENEKK